MENAPSAFQQKLPEGVAAILAHTGKSRSFLRDVPIHNVIREGIGGCEISVRLTSYRALPLSCIENLQLKIDGEEIDPKLIQLVLNGVSYKVSDMENLSNVWWFILDAATVFVPRSRRLLAGKHRVDAKLVTVEPYITAGRFSFYNSDSRELCVDDTYPVLPSTESMPDRKGLKLGVTFHSFTDEYVSYKWSLEDMFQLAGWLGGGVEIVGPAHQRGFPHLSDEFERTFKSAVERWGLTPTCYGTYSDPFMLKQRDLTPEESVEYIVPQLKSASRLGFKIVRLQYYAHTIAERLLPWAERLDLKMGYELHAPLAIESEVTQELIVQIKKYGSPRLGLIPDTSIFARDIPDFRVASIRNAGLSENILSRAIELWKAGVSITQALKELQAIGLAKEHIATMEPIWGTLAQSDPKALATILPYVIHVHGKFYGMKNGDEPSIRFEEVIKELVEGGYDGWMSSEYEGPGDVDTFHLVREHQEMARRYIGKYEITAGERGDK